MKMDSELKPNVKLIVIWESKTRTCLELKELKIGFGVRDKILNQVELLLTNMFSGGIEWDQWYEMG